MSKRRLALRLYILTAAISIAVMASLLVLPRFVRSPRYLEPQAALVQNLVDRVSLREPSALPEVFERLRRRLKGDLTLYRADGSTVASTAERLPGPTASEKKTLAKDKWALSWRRIVVRSDDSSMIGIYVPNSGGFPWGFVLPMSVGAIAMSLSTIVVAINAQLLRRLDLRRSSRPTRALEPHPA